MWLNKRYVTICGIISVFSLDENVAKSELSDKYLLYSGWNDGWSTWDLAFTLAEVLNALSTSLQPQYC